MNFSLSGELVKAQIFKQIFAPKLLLIY